VQSPNYEWETQPATLKDEHRLVVFLYRALRKIFGPKREEAQAG